MSESSHLTAGTDHGESRLAVQNCPRPPILVTGIHRSGTSWVGMMLAADDVARYICEPLSVDFSPRAMRGVVAHWYQYVCRENEDTVLPALAELLSFRYHAWLGRLGVRCPKDLWHACEDSLRCLRHMLFPRPALLKCPFSVFSIPWFIERLQARVVVTVRHPLAVTSSLKRLQWPIDFRDLLAQPLLMRDVLAPYEADMRRCVDTPGDIIGQGILLWRMIYQTVADYRRRFPQILLARHEDLSLAPIERYRELYSALDLPFTPRVEAIVTRATSADNPTELPLHLPHDISLDSRANLQNWRSRLAPAEVARVQAETADVARLYYADSASFGSAKAH